MTNSSRCAVVAVVGPPNAGKSTLLNRLAGQHLAIVSARPQSTRSRVTAIITEGDTQLVIVDTPGLMDPRYHLHRAMQSEAWEAVDGADVVLFLVDGTRPDAPGPDILRSLGPLPSHPMVVGISKADVNDDETKAALSLRFPQGVHFSARSEMGMPQLFEAIRSVAPIGPFHYPEDDLSTQPMRFFVAEALREVAFELLEEELPYAVHVEIDEFREGSRPLYIRATLHVERDSQKRILIGAKGAQIRSIGQAARARIETLVGEAVYLDLWVKVLHNWRRDMAALQRLGFTFKQE